MRKYIVCGIILLFVGLAIMPSIYADRDKEFFLEQTPEIDTFDYDGYTPIKLVFLLINKLRNCEDIESIESEDDVLLIIESNVELISIVEILKDYSCGCEDDSSVLQWNFPFICLFLFPLVVISAIASLKFLIELPYFVLITIGSILNCVWYES